MPSRFQRLKAMARRLRMMALADDQRSDSQALSEEEDLSEVLASCFVLPGWFSH